uniref:Uncharacterized protein n=1 Tax=Oryza punctata TaxID=4537 RepID=A0A0E0MFM4_ORYPU
MSRQLHPRASIDTKWKNFPKSSQPMTQSENGGEELVVLVAQWRRRGDHPCHIRVTVATACRIRIATAVAATGQIRDTITVAGRIRITADASNSHSHTNE